jgi:hypothetical protein
MALPASSHPDEDGGPCPRCFGTRMLVSTHVVGEPVTIILCGECGYSRWRSEDEILSLHRVLDRARALAHGGDGHVPSPGTRKTRPRVTGEPAADTE